MEGVIRFLRTERSKEELELALNVLMDFRALESPEEWERCSFESWKKLEQFQNYLQILVGAKLTDIDDEEAEEYYKKIKEERG